MPSTINELLARGYGYVLVAKIQGIPDLFPETIPLRVEAEAPPSLPSGYRSACPALMFDDSVAMTQEADRATGLSRGDAVEVCLSRDPLRDAGLGATLFRRPSKRTRLTSDLDATDTVGHVETTSDWYPGDYAFIGRELTQVLEVDTGRFALARGLCGPLAYAYRSNSPTTFATLTDRPEQWRGRFMTIYLHVLSPEGRILDDTWCAGDYCREEWSGSVDQPPKPGRTGMVIRCMPMFRLPGEELGYEIDVEVVSPDPEDASSWKEHPIVVTPESTITITGEWTGPGPSSGTFSISVPNIASTYVSTVAGWTRKAQADLQAALLSEPWSPSGAAEIGLHGAVLLESWDPMVPGSLAIKIEYDAPTYDVESMVVTVREGSSAYWLIPGQREGVKGLHNDPIWNWLLDWPAVSLAYPIGSWLPVLQTSGEGFLDLAVPSAGVGLAEVDGKKELIRWDSIASALAPNDNVVLLHIVERSVAGTPRVNLVGAKLKFVTGADGTPADVLLALLESTGTGASAHDTLGIGLGYGIPSAQVDEPSFARAELSEATVPAFSDGRTSLETLMGGWLALSGLCLVQRRNAAGVLQLSVVPTEPLAVASVGAVEIAILPEHVELAGLDTPETYDAPSEVRVSRSGVSLEVPDIIVQDVPGLQQSMPRSAAFSCPGMGEQTARNLATNRLAVGLGQTIITVAIAPWLDLQIGDPVAWQVPHPAVYDWATGTWGPGQVAGRVLGRTWKPWSGRATATFVLAGLMREGLYLCPVAGLTALPTSDTFDVNVDLTALIAPTAPSIRVRLYNAGQEATEMAEVDVDVVSPTSLQLASGSHAAWVAAGVTRMTFCNLGGGNDDQVEGAYLFQASSRHWGP